MNVIFGVKRSILLTSSQICGALPVLDQTGARSLINSYLRYNVVITGIKIVKKEMNQFPAGKRPNGSGVFRCYRMPSR